MKHLTRKNAIRVLLITIFIVVMRMIYNTHECLETNGLWNAKTQVCELKPISK